MRGALMQRVYVWQAAVRMFHWINAACIVTLLVTGLLIGNPLAFRSSYEASAGYWFGTVRFIHFATAYVLVLNFLFRVYWGFVGGNKYATWRTFLPLTKAQWQDIYRVLRVDIMLGKVEHPLQEVGHNALARVSYFVSFLVTLALAATGFALYAPMSDARLPRLFTWVVPLMGGDQNVRQWHHILMWFFPVFILIHVYLTFYHDHVEGRGVMSSMAGGWKFIDAPHAHAHPPAPAPAPSSTPAMAAPPASGGAS